jgi:hypothetical protein
MRIAAFYLLLLMLAPRAATPQNPAPLLAGTFWDGALADVSKGSTPAKLNFILKNGDLNGLLVSDGSEERFLTTISAPRGIRMHGLVVRDLTAQGRKFYLDTFTGEISQDGHMISGTAVSQSGARSRWEFRRVGGR